LRKLTLIATAFAAVLAVTAVAVAAQINTYAVTAKVTPSSGGSKSKPKPIALSLAFEVSEAAGQRPAVVRTYQIGLGKTKVNGGAFPRCSATKLNGDQSDSGCPKGSRVGEGKVFNATGNSADLNDRSVRCDLALRLYSDGAKKANLWLFPANPGDCPIHTFPAIPAEWVTSGGSPALRFTVPQALRHPLPGLDNALVRTEVNIPRVTRTVKGKKVGFLSSTGCKGSRRVGVRFTTEAGQVSTANVTLKC